MPIGDGELGGKPSSEPLLNLPGALDTVSPTLGFKIECSDTFLVSISASPQHRGAWGNVTAKQDLSKLGRERQLGACVLHEIRVTSEHRTNIWVSLNNIWVSLTLILLFLASLLIILSALML